ncbi:dihydrofolate reductase family protein [Candidatus Woesearchaeota archaeon]|nr:dihydrofolate reductase family protein [Candidatus Woesearchaeota archaeon]MCF7901475.1 dihydrofolate reductase family protein [Candidatus Woesearchaeota archaeon]MCF8013192.1 dihydrofolate reductase family protein [Candidatus Woesearchaeota archaeon]
MVRKIILNVAMSLDGFIADERGGFDWIKGDGDKSNDTKNVFDFSKFLSSVDTIVMGKVAFLDCPKETLDSFKDHKIFVASNNKFETDYSNVQFFSGDLVNKIVDLQKMEGKNIWLFGGANLVDQFIKANVIDEYVIGIVPIILGKGKSLFLENNFMINLHLKETIVQEGIVIINYSKTY